MNRLALFLCLLAACGGGVTADQACSDSSAAQCAKLDACHVSGVALRYGDMATCIARTKANCLLAMQAPGSGRTPANQEACATAYTTATCTDYLQNTIAACQPPAGVRTTGQRCTFSAQCQSAFCAIAPGSGCGACAAAPAIGQSCAMSQCANGQVCDSVSTTCKAYAGSGGACSASGECQAGLDCVIAVAGMPGVCQAGGATAGTACDRKAGPICDYLKGQYCSVALTGTAGVCAAYLQASPGQACGYTAGSATTGSTFTLCVGGSSCVVPTGMSAGTCVAYAADGKPCDTALGPACLSPARCVIAAGTSGTCQLPDPITCS